jgi:hypothetical protein
MFIVDQLSQSQIDRQASARRGMSACRVNHCVLIQ